MKNTIIMTITFNFINIAQKILQFFLGKHQEEAKFWQNFRRLEHNQICEEQREWKISTRNQIREVYQAVQRQRPANQGNSCRRQV